MCVCVGNSVFRDTCLHARTIGQGRRPGASKVTDSERRHVSAKRGNKARAADRTVEHAGLAGRRLHCQRGRLAIQADRVQEL